jgi:RNA polymerase sigma factor (sigma-70 family)
MVTMDQVDGPVDADRTSKASATVGRSTTGGGWDDFAPLYDEHHERLYRLALLLTHGSTAAADDAVAETFVRVYRAWADGHVDNFFPYARRALVNEIAGSYRREELAARQAAVQSGDLRGQQGLEDAVVDAVSTFELLRQLPPRQRTAVVLRYYEDLSYEQIAETMAVSVGTAKAQVSTGLQRLRELMKRDTS